MPSPLVMLAAVAARTRTIKLGSAIALAPLYHPVRFAEECAVLDILANGRLEIAIAIGYRRREAEAYGVDFSAWGRRTDGFWRSCAGSGGERLFRTMASTSI